MQQLRIVADGGGGGGGQIWGTSIMEGGGRDYKDGKRSRGGFQYLEYKLKYNNTYI